MNAKLTSFATYRDLRGFIVCLQEGHTSEFCYNRGDNGEGATGLITAQTKTPMIALPPEEIRSKWGTTKKGMGKLVDVTMNGKTVRCTLADIGPKGVCDLNPAVLLKFGLSQETELNVQGSWEWVD